MPPAWPWVFPLCRFPRVGASSPPTCISLLLPCSSFARCGRWRTEEFSDDFTEPKTQASTGTWILSVSLFPRFPALLQGWAAFLRLCSSSLAGVRASVPSTHGLSAVPPTNEAFCLVLEMKERGLQCITQMIAVSLSQPAQRRKLSLRFPHPPGKNLVGLPVGKTCKKMEILPPHLGVNSRSLFLSR